LNPSLRKLLLSGALLAGIYIGIRYLLPLLVLSVMIVGYKQLFS
jgi:hypothetical protein